MSVRALSCEFLNYPVVSGNVSFYNGTNKKNIDPTPVIGGVGLIEKLSNTINHKFKKTNSVIFLIGKTFGHLGQSCFLKENYSLKEGSPPSINLLNEKNNGEAILKLIKASKDYMHKVFVIGKDAHNDMVNVIENLSLIKILRMEDYQTKKFHLRTD